MCFFVKLGLRVTPLIYATPLSSGNFFLKLRSDWLSAGSNVVASESMIFVFEFISKPFAYSPKGIFFSTFFHSSSLVDGIFCRLVLCFCVWPCFNRVVDPVWHQLLHLERLWRAAKISFLFPTFRFCSLDVANKHGRYHLAFAYLNAVKGYSTFEDFWRLYGPNCWGYRGQASICTYESTSEHEFYFVIVDKFPTPGLTWHESFCFSLLAPLVWIFFLASWF